MFFKVAHHSTCRIKPKGAAARQQHSVDALDEVHRSQQVGLARGGCASTHIDAAHGRCVAQNDGAARAALQVRIVSHANARYVGDIVMHDGCLSAHSVKEGAFYRR